MTKSARAILVKSSLISQHVVAANAGTDNHRRWLSTRSLNREAAAYGSPLSRGTTRGKSAGASNLAGDVLLHLVGDLDQPPPRPLQERHHAIHVAVARQRNFDLALALGHLRLRLLQRVRFRQRLVDLAGDGRLAGRQFCPELFLVGLQPADFGVERRAFVRYRIAGPAGGGG